MLAKLERAQYVRHDGARFVLVDDGREVLEKYLDRERATALRKMRERRAARLARIK